MRQNDNGAFGVALFSQFVLTIFVALGLCNYMNLLELFFKKKFKCHISINKRRNYLTIYLFVYVLSSDYTLNHTYLVYMGYTDRYTKKIVFFICI